MAYGYLASTASSGQALIVRELFYDPVDALTVAVLIFAAVRFRGQDERVWLWLSLAVTGWALADLAAIFLEVPGSVGAQRLLGPPDVFYVIAYGALVAGVLALGRTVAKPGGGFDWTRWYPLGAAASVVSLTALFAYFLPQGVSPAAPGAVVTLPMLVDYLYPALDIVLLAGLMFALLFSKMPWRHSWSELTVAGIAFFLVSDISYSFSAPAGVYDPANLPSRLVIGLWIAGYGLLLLAAVHKLTDPATRPVSTAPYVSSETEA